MCFVWGFLYQCVEGPFNLMKLESPLDMLNKLKYCIVSNLPGFGKHTKNMNLLL